jgi:hypothetical protein
MRYDVRPKAGAAADSAAASAFASPPLRSGQFRNISLPESRSEIDLAFRKPTLAFLTIAANLSQTAPTETHDCRSEIAYTLVF